MKWTQIALSQKKKVVLGAQQRKKGPIISSNFVIFMLIRF